MRRGFLHLEIRVHAKAARLLSGMTVGRAIMALRMMYPQDRTGWNRRSSSSTHKRPAVNILEATSKLLRSCLGESFTFENLNGTNAEDKSSTV